jgi:hypothetical protein
LEFICYLGIVVCDFPYIDAHYFITLTPAVYAVIGGNEW